MLFIVMVFGVLMIAIGVYAIASPPGLIRVAEERFVAGPGVAGGFILRLLLAVALGAFILGSSLLGPAT